MSENAKLPTVLNPRPAGRALTRREVLQRVLAVAGAALAGPVGARAHPMYRHLVDPASLEGAGAKVAGPEWSPQFLDSHQNEILIAAAEATVPGAAKAQVNRVIDLLLTVETAENQQMFTAALAALDAESTKRFNRALAQLDATQLDELLSRCSAEASKHPAQHDDSAADWKTNQKLPVYGPANLRDHFENLKGWIVATYYSSEEGMRELGWTDDFYFESPAECSHPDGHS